MVCYGHSKFSYTEHCTLLNESTARGGAGCGSTRLLAARNLEEADLSDQNENGRLQSSRFIASQCQLQQKESSSTEAKGENSVNLRDATAL